MRHYRIVADMKAAAPSAAPFRHCIARSRKGTLTTLQTSDCLVLFDGQTAVRGWFVSSDGKTLGTMQPEELGVFAACDDLVELIA